MTLELAAELALAILLGGVIGLERELRDKPAGLRTHILICLGAALFANLAHRLGAQGGDPGRLAGHIVAGVGFIGAGTILHQGSTVTGLTTAANIWVVAAIGMTVGFGAYVDASMATAFVVLVLTGLGGLEKMVGRRYARHFLLVNVDPTPAAPLDAVAPVMTALSADGMTARLLGLRVEHGERTAHLELSSAGLDDEALVRKVLSVPGVRGARSA